MCLYPTQYNAKVAEKDIICYKVVVRDDNHKNRFTSIHFEYTYFPGRIYVEPSFKSDLKIQNTVISINGKVKYTTATAPEVKLGFHSYMHLSKAKLRLCEYIKDYWFCCPSNKKFIILKCIIPAGSLYYTGASGETTDVSEYCSQYIKVCAWKTIHGKWHTES